MVGIKALTVAWWNMHPKQKNAANTKAKMPACAIGELKYFCILTPFFVFFSVGLIMLPVPARQIGRIPPCCPDYLCIFPLP
jgi:hypothetical protein